MENVGSTVKLTKTDSEKDLGIWITYYHLLNPLCNLIKMQLLLIESLECLSKHSLKLSRELFVFLYRAYVRLYLEYCIQLWCPYLVCDIDKLENVQRQATKLVIELANSFFSSLHALQWAWSTLWVKIKSTWALLSLLSMTTWQFYWGLQSFTWLLRYWFVKILYSEFCS